MSEPLTLDTLTFDRLVIIICVCALASSSLTQVVKSIFKSRSLSDAGIRRPLLRSISVILGGSFGYSVGGFTQLGAIVGIGAGSLTTFVVAQIRSKIKASTQEKEDF
tara:strand:+ start:575 stop:895 length:321 start_codon:yes stop_codon:yes gene_type:complete